MAKAVEIEEAANGVTEEVLEYLWKIPNFVTIQDNEELILDQKFEAVTRGSSSIQCKWLIGLTLENSSIIHLSFQLIESGEGASPISANASVQYAYNGCWRGRPSIQNSTCRNEIFLVKLGWLCKQGARYWIPLIDQEGALVFNIRLSLQVPGNRGSTLTRNAIKNFKSRSFKKVQSNFASILEDVDSSDVKIICSDGKELFAHKLILKVQNEVFSAMFRSDLLENNTGVIKVDDVTEKTMRLVLHYLYTGELLPSWCEADTIVEFTYAAGKYQLTEVLDLLDKVLGNEENETKNCNVILLSLAKKLSLKTAEAKLMERIVKLTVNARNSEELLGMFGNSI